MSVWFVSRHLGAVVWAKNNQLKVDFWVKHLSIEDISNDDVVIGILPVNIAAEVCARGARYFNLSINLPYNLRGKELSEDDLVLAGAKLEEFIVLQKRRNE